MKVLCALTCLDTEIGKNTANIKRSFDVISSVFKEKVSFLVVVQSAMGPASRIAADQVDSLCQAYGASMITADYLSISRARNDAIEFAAKNAFDKMFFHDVSIVYTVEACQHFKKFCASPLVPSVWPLFDLEKPLPASIEDGVRNEKPRPVKNSYVWTYLLDVSTLGTVRFDLDFGGGDCSTYKSGEDLLFLYEALVSKGKRLIVNRNAFVRHPSRGISYQKHLAYALGQGRTFRIILKQYPSPDLYLHFMLFYANALLRVLLCKQFSVQILFLRLKGFLTPN